ncbi:MAG TPA: nucleoside hydrolase [Oligoflexia bacterium]|nr:nucleoside hydrolase [Oligoflexia bacterium]HMR24308.1 nucleoside hydrolase [Oligoflexia bacterium]
MKFYLVGIFLVFSCACAQVQKIWIDTDVAMYDNKLLQYFHDVDDILALLHIVHVPNMKIEGIATLYGNAGHHRAFKSALKVVSEQNKNIPIYSGAKRSRYFKETEAQIALIESLEKNDDLIIIALGPLTNIASVILKRPDLIPKIKNLILVGGRRSEKFWKFKIGPKYIPDANIAHDIFSSDLVLKLLKKITIVPFELARQMFFDQYDMERLGNINEKMYEVRRQINPWFQLWKFVGEEGFNPFDLFAVGYVSHPHLFDCYGVEQYRLNQLKLGMKKKDILEVIELKQSKYARIQYCINIDQDFKYAFFENLENSNGQGLVLDEDNLENTVRD